MCVRMYVCVCLCVCVCVCVCECEWVSGWVAGSVPRVSKCAHTPLYVSMQRLWPHTYSVCMRHALRGGSLSAFDKAGRRAASGRKQYK